MSSHLEGYVRGVLSAERLSRHGLFAMREVQHLIEQMYAHRGDYRHANKVMALIIFQEWYDLYAA